MYILAAMIIVFILIILMAFIDVVLVKEQTRRDDVPWNPTRESVEEYAEFSNYDMRDQDD